MPFDFANTMKQASDAELLKIGTADRNRYQEAAVLAAEAELGRGNLTQKQITDADMFNEHQQQILSLKGNTNLNFHN